LQFQIACPVNFFNRAQLSICDSLWMKSSGELDAVALGKAPFRLLVHRDAIHLPRVVGDEFSILPLHRNQILVVVGGTDPNHFARGNIDGLVASRVAQNVAWLLVLRPEPVLTGDVLAGNKHSHLLFLLADLAKLLHLGMDGRRDL